MAKNILEKDETTPDGSKKGDSKSKAKVKKHSTKGKRKSDKGKGSKKKGKRLFHRVHPRLLHLTVRVKAWTLNK